MQSSLGKFHEAALMRLWVVALLQSQAWGVAASSLSPVQIAQLRLAAKFAPLDTEFCGSVGGLPSPADFQLAQDPLFKFFAYDTQDDLTWVLREEVQQCLESVSNSAVNGTEWVGQANLWEAAKGMFQKLGQSVDPNNWIRRQWLELNPTLAADTVLRTASYRTAPMSSYPDASLIQQPCNALSNYAYYEIALIACNNAVSDFGGTWPWRSEAIAAPVMLAFASFSMHSNPIRNPFDTNVFDPLAIRVLAFQLFQGYVRSLAVDLNEPGVAVVLGITPDEPFGDARDLVRQLHSIWSGPAAQWASAQALIESVPDFEISVSSVILILMYNLLSDTVGPGLGRFFYRELCIFLADAVVRESDGRAWDSLTYLATIIPLQLRLSPHTFFRRVPHELFLVPSTTQERLAERFFANLVRHLWTPSRPQHGNGLQPLLRVGNLVGLEGP